MIIGECPYDDCDDVHFISIAEKCPAVSDHVCDKCKRIYYIYHSRVDPGAFTEEDFKKHFIIDKAEMTFKIAP
jgi:hypothetical protein